jgi:uncharacterized membrane protein (UPF0127 family)
MARRSAVLLILALLGWPLVAAVRAPAAEQGTLEIVTRSGVRPFSVELAVTDEERATGLMFRKEIPEGYGMLFDFKQDQMVTMWMKNTYVSLDMIFIKHDGRIARIAENTKVLSEDIIPSGQPVRAVLEVVAGTAKKYGIAPGDKVGYPIFNAR